MEKIQKSEIIFILDRSGSMYNLVDDVVGGFNSFIDEQKKDPENSFFTLVTFSDTYDISLDTVPISEVSTMKQSDYRPGGNTALNDAIGHILQKKIASYSTMDDSPKRVVVAIMTDGHENASKEFNASKIKEMVNDLTAKEWTFMFLAANIDAFATGSSYGFQTTNTVSFAASSKDVNTNFRSISRSYAKSRSLSDTEYTLTKDSLLSEANEEIKKEENGENE